MGDVIPFPGSRKQVVRGATSRGVVVEAGCSDYCKTLVDNGAIDLRSDKEKPGVATLTYGPDDFQVTILSPQGARLQAARLIAQAERAERLESGT